ncbi:hypothetical protein MKJ04_14265 [Pontibacter sp. E15-1]|uniref:hypothetical protein n=1 Tax=Pontibacter sp. E15-1 TaxID=2919918 RepID=UPI001F4F42E8|nr:hypothetical protein [Pontibacter sp. E15-1]MCJ8166008.1 hypothetical protein [Pontibacter sp. E15-1]
MANLIRNSEMNAKKLLTHRYINNAAIADDLFPNQKHSKQTLSNKLHEVLSGTGNQRLTEKDCQKLLALFERFLNEVR